MRELKCKFCGKPLPWFSMGKVCAVCAVERMRRDHA
jgi:hypothetical protein